MSYIRNFNLKTQAITKATAHINADFNHNIVLAYAFAIMQLISEGFTVMLRNEVPYAHTKLSRGAICYSNNESTTVCLTFYVLITEKQITDI